MAMNINLYNKLSEFFFYDRDENERHGFALKQVDVIHQGFGL